MSVCIGENSSFDGSLIGEKHIRWEYFSMTHMLSMAVAQMDTQELLGVLENTIVPSLPRKHIIDLYDP